MVKIITDLKNTARLKELIGVYIADINAGTKRTKLKNLDGVLISKF